MLFMFNHCFWSWNQQENYEKLLKRNIKLEAEMEEMNSSFQGLKVHKLNLRDYC